MLYTHYTRLFICILFGTLAFACNNPQNTSDAPEGEDIDVKTVGDDSTSQEWQALFDGTSADQWRNFKGEQMDWQVEDGMLTTPGGKGDIITKEQYGNFELTFDWKIEEGSNSGVMYLVKEGDYEATYHTGPEYQIIDAEGFSRKNNSQLDSSQITGANYALQAPSTQAAKPVGEWNQSKIIVNEGHVEHWLNGQQVIAYDLWTDEWKQAVSQTKFREWPAYGMAKEGHIALQDHGDPVWFRNIRIREL